MNNQLTLKYFYLRQTYKCHQLYKIVTIWSSPSKKNEINNSKCCMLFDLYYLLEFTVNWGTVTYKKQTKQVISSCINVKKWEQEVVINDCEHWKSTFL